MKFTFLLLLCCLTFFYAVSQNKPMTQKEAMAQMEKELAELEKEDPEAARKLRELMAKQYPSASKSKPAQQASLKKTKPPVETIILKQPVATPSVVQANQKLWLYSVKKINDTTFIATTGTLIQEQKKKKRIVIQPRKDPFSHLVKELAKHEERKKELADLFAKEKNSFFFYTGLVNALDEVDRTNEAFRKIASNVIDVNSLTKSSTLTGHGKGGYSFFNGIPDSIQKLYDEAMDMMSHPDPLTYPPPPVKVMDVCHACDEAAQEKYYNDVQNWRNEFTAFEKKLFELSVQVSRALVDKSDPVSISMNENMTKAMEFCFLRKRQKLENLEKEEGDNIRVIPLLILENLSLARQEDLFGATLSESEVNEISGKIVVYIDKVLDYAYQQMLQKNYNIGLNLSIYLSLMRQKSLMKEVNTAEEFAAFTKRFSSFNRFKLSISYFSSVSSDNLKATAKVESTGNNYVSLGLFNCRFILYLTDTDHEQAEEQDYRLNLSVTGGIKSMKDENGNWVEYHYSGPKEMMAVVPAFNINFCNNNAPDSTAISIVMYKDDQLASQAKSAENAYTVDMMAYLNLLVIDANKLEGAVPQMNQIGYEMLSVHAMDEAQQTTGIKSLDQMQIQYNKAADLLKLQTSLSGLVNAANLIMVYDAKNYSSTLIEETANVKSQAGGMDVSGYVKIKVEHAPKNE